MSALIGASPLGLAMIKHKNEIIARKGFGMGATNINREVRSIVAKQEDDHAAGQRNRSLNRDRERTGSANPVGERTA
jgi:hypothetical protein